MYLSLLRQGITAVERDVSCGRAPGTSHQLRGKPGGGEVALPVAIRVGMPPSHRGALLPVHPSGSEPPSPASGALLWHMPTSLSIITGATHPDPGNTERNRRAWGETAAVLQDQLDLFGDPNSLLCPASTAGCTCKPCPGHSAEIPWDLRGRNI